MFNIVQVQSGDMPEPGGSHSLIHHDNQLYLVGGRNGQGACHKIWKFNLLTRKWRVMGREPAEIQNANAMATAIKFGNGLLIIYFGLGRGYLFPFTGARKFCFVPLTWSGVPRPARYTRQKPALIQCPDDTHKIYVFRPRMHGRKTVLDVYTLTMTDVNGRWATVDVQVTGECEYRTRDINEGVAAVLHDRKVYILNLPTIETVDRSDIYTHFNELYAFDLDTRCWEKVSTKTQWFGGFHFARHLHSVVLYNDVVYLVGGMTVDDKHFFNAVLQLNLKTRTWQKSMSSATVTAEGCVYVFGGYEYKYYGGPDEAAASYSNQLQTVRLQPPSLKWIAFHKVTDVYAEKMHICDPQSLLAMGIPPDFVRSIQE